MKFIKVIIALLCTNTILAQLSNEIGISFGGSNYLGDIGQEIYIAPNKLAGGIIYKRNINTRISLRTSIYHYKIADNDKNSNIENRRVRDNNFSNQITELSFGVEVNYWNFDITSSNNTYTPYVVTEFAILYYNVVSSENIDGYHYMKKISYSIPFGIGFKSKIVDRFSCAIEVRAHFTFIDDLDYNHKEIQSLKFGNPNNNDWYFFVGASLSYSFGRSPCTSP